MRTKRRKFRKKLSSQQVRFFLSLNPKKYSRKIIVSTTVFKVMTDPKGIIDFKAMVVLKVMVVFKAISSLKEINPDLQTKISRSPIIKHNVIDN